jgi:hypothetical protein
MSRYSRATREDVRRNRNAAVANANANGNAIIWSAEIQRSPIAFAVSPRNVRIDDANQSTVGRINLV